MNLTEVIIQGRLDRQVDELETSHRLSGQTFESLPLKLGDTTIDRELLSDGTKGQVRICTQEVQGLMGSVVIYRNYLLKDGNIITDSSYGGEERKLRGFRKAITLAKIAFSKVDHWNRESDFYGTYEEEK